MPKNDPVQLPSDLRHFLEHAANLLDQVARIRSNDGLSTRLAFGKVVMATNELESTLRSVRDQLQNHLPELTVATSGVVTCGTVSSVTAIEVLVELAENTVDLLTYVRQKLGIAAGSEFTLGHREHFCSVMGSVTHPSIVELKRLDAELWRSFLEAAKRRTASTEIEWSRPISKKFLREELGISQTTLADRLTLSYTPVPSKYRYRAKNKMARKIEIAIVDLPAKLQGSLRPKTP